MELRETHVIKGSRKVRNRQKSYTLIKCVAEEMYKIVLVALSCAER